MRSRRRLYVARLLAIIFLVAGGYKAQQATQTDNLIFYADALMYLGLAWIWKEKAREEDHK